MGDFVQDYHKKTPTSERLHLKACSLLPGGVSHNQHHFFPYPIYVSKAKGSRIWDVDGNEYIDLWMGHYIHILGHHAEVVTEAVERQLREGYHWGAVFEKQIELAELVRQTVPSAEMVRFCCSGTEATMYAVRLARAFTGRKTVLKIAGGWHGANTELSVSIKWPYDRPESIGLIPELDQYTKAIPFNDIEGTLEIIHRNRKDLACVILEPVIGEGGFTPVTGEYLAVLRSETADAGAILIFDEIISGYRLSLGGAQKVFGITPDLTTLGKIVGGGLPIGVVAGRRDILEMSSPERKVKKWERVLIGGGTFSSHPLTVAAGLAMLGHLKANEAQIYPALDEKGKKVRDGISSRFERAGVRAVVTGIGSLFQTHFPNKDGIRFDSPHKINQYTDIEKREFEFRLRMLNHGVYVMHGGGALSTAHTDSDIDMIIDAAEKVAKEMGHEIQ